MNIKGNKAIHILQDYPSTFGRFHAQSVRYNLNTQKDLWKSLAPWKRVKLCVNNSPVNVFLFILFISTAHGLFSTHDYSFLRRENSLVQPPGWLYYWFFIECVTDSGTDGRNQWMRQINRIENSQVMLASSRLLLSSQYFCIFLDICTRYLLMDHFILLKSCHLGIQSLFLNVGGFGKLSEYKSEE